MELVRVLTDPNGIAMDALSRVEPPVKGMASTFVADPASLQAIVSALVARDEVTAAVLRKLVSPDASGQDMFWLLHTFAEAERTAMFPTCVSTLQASFRARVKEYVSKSIQAQVWALAADVWTNGRASGSAAAIAALRDVPLCRKVLHVSLHPLMVALTCNASADGRVIADTRAWCIARMCKPTPHCTVLLTSTLGVEPQADPWSSDTVAFVIAACNWGDDGAGPNKQTVQYLVAHQRVALLCFLARRGGDCFSMFGRHQAAVLDVLVHALHDPWPHGRKADIMLAVQRFVPRFLCRGEGHRNACGVKCALEFGLSAEATEAFRAWCTAVVSGVGRPPSLVTQIREHLQRGCDNRSCWTPVNERQQWSTWVELQCGAPPASAAEGLVRALECAARAVAPLTILGDGLGRPGVRTRRMADRIAKGLCTHKPSPFGGIPVVMSRGGLFWIVRCVMARGGIRWGILWRYIITHSSSLPRFLGTRFNDESSPSDYLPNSKIGVFWGDFRRMLAVIAKEAEMGVDFAGSQLAAYLHTRHLGGTLAGMAALRDVYNDTGIPREIRERLFATMARDPDTHPATFLRLVTISGPWRSGDLAPIGMGKTAKAYCFILMCIAARLERGRACSTKAPPLCPTGFPRELVECIYTIWLAQLP